MAFSLSKVPCISIFPIHEILALSKKKPMHNGDLDKAIRTKQ